MIKKNLEFCFKGERTYVHGTDIYNKLSELINQDCIKVDLSFHGIVKTNIKLLEVKPDNEDLLKFAFKYTDRDERKTIYGIENNQLVECRYQYPEENIYKLSNLNLQNKEVTLTQDSSFTFVENVVALNKYLLENLFPEANGKWYFTRIQIDTVNFEKIYPLKLILKANFNFKLTKTEVFIDDISIGYIYFSLV